MAIKSTAGATITKVHATGSAVSWGNQKYAGWIKVPSHADRTLFVHGGLAIKLTAAGKLRLTLDSADYDGTTVFPTDTWIFWSYKHTSATALNELRAHYVNALGGMTTLVVEISVVDALGATPTEFVIHVPAGCSVTCFRYGASGAGTLTYASWGVGASSTFVWAACLRFPADLNDHREVSTASTATFQTMHAITSTTGSLTLDADDPAPLVPLLCAAVLDVRVSTMVWAGPTYGVGPGPIIMQPAAFNIPTDRLPANADFDRFTIGATGVRSNLTGPYDAPGQWEFGGDPTLWGGQPSIAAVPGGYYSGGPHFGLGFTYYDWSHFGAANPTMPAGLGGQPMTVSDLYDAVIWIGYKYNYNSGPGSVTGPNITLSEIGITCLYYGAAVASLVPELDPSAPPCCDDCGGSSLRCCGKRRRHAAGHAGELTSPVQNSWSNLAPGSANGRLLNPETPTPITGDSWY